jgi:hypothetical protein
MATIQLPLPEKVKVNRSQLRQSQSKILRQAKGRTIIEIPGWTEEDGKYVVDKRYFDDLLRKFRATVETLEITADPKLFGQILRAAPTLDQDARSRKLHSFDEAFGEE